MGSPIIATYHNSTHGVLKTPTDIALYLIRWTFANPGDTSSQLEGEMVSFRVLEAHYGKSPDELSSALSGALKRAMDHYFPDKYEVTVDYSESNDGTGNYSLSIDISDKDGISICRRHLIEIDADSNFTVHAEGEEGSLV